MRMGGVNAAHPFLRYNYVISRILRLNAKIGGIFYSFFRYFVLHNSKFVYIFVFVIDRYAACRV